ncbi:conserved hypothetical protein [Uncinocarpus reesii 1704]|uniref:Major facilitator superfamily (MFS) profile domain-containing protein n=1 Tax=Uncinocarpus reesii (strain UAMH 1704) TaxID=336963 RepID=C4JJB5_UNCRE|nr:uncharacterized protein UREG_01722 [Uncinocarpus reesii 1704]EEP76873.1 conserved hypothetical protein [Uncinocarpus reesii 1704]
MCTYCRTISTAVPYSDHHTVIIGATSEIRIIISKSRSAVVKGSREILAASHRFLAAASLISAFKDWLPSENDRYHSRNPCNSITLVIRDRLVPELMEEVTILKSNNVSYWEDERFGAEEASELTLKRQDRKHSDPNGIASSKPSRYHLREFRPDNRCRWLVPVRNRLLLPSPNLLPILACSRDGCVEMFDDQGDQVAPPKINPRSAGVKGQWASRGRNLGGPAPPSRCLRPPGGPKSGNMTNRRDISPVRPGSVDAGAQHEAQYMQGSQDNLPSTSYSSFSEKKQTDTPKAASTDLLEYLPITHADEEKDPFQAWISANQLKGYSQSSISWIFGVYAFLMFFGGLQIGPVFDAKGPKMLVIAGTITCVLSVALLGSCQQYWHFMLVYGILGGIGISLVFTPAVASPGHFFFRLRGRATGLAATGGSVGGIVYPLMLDNLYPKIGFAWATRAVALVSLVTMTVGCILIKSRLPKKRATKENILPDLRILMEPVFAFTTAGIFFIEWGLFIPITFMTSYALYHDMPRGLSFQLLAFLNVGSFFGRWIPGFTADYMGRFNTMIATVLLCLLTTACLWLPAGNSISMMIVYALLFGFASGSNISLTPVCVGQVCKTEHYGRYYATAYTVVSFGTLTGTPIAGSILTRNGGDYWGLITFTSCCYFAGLVCFIIAKVLRVGWNPLTID